MNTDKPTETVTISRELAESLLGSLDMHEGAASKGHFAFWSELDTKARDELRAALDGRQHGQAEQVAAYSQAIREFLDLATDFAETRRGYLRFLELADQIEEKMPEFRDEDSEPPETP